MLKDPSGGKFMKINHMHLHVKNIEASKEFYKTFFAFTDHMQITPKFQFIRDQQDFDLALEECDSVPDFPNWFHFGFRLDSESEVRSLFEKMKSASDVHVGELGQDEDRSWFFCKDPDGHRLEVYYE
jgi:catechol-2,3-dioxygenase